MLENLKDKMQITGVQKNEFNYTDNYTKKEHTYTVIRGILNALFSFITNSWRMFQSNWRKKKRNFW